MFISKSKSIRYLLHITNFHLYINFDFYIRPTQLSFIMMTNGGWHNQLCWPRKSPTNLVLSLVTANKAPRFLASRPLGCLPSPWLQSCTWHSRSRRQSCLPWESQGWSQSWISSSTPKALPTYQAHRSLTFGSRSARSRESKNCKVKSLDDFCYHQVT